MLRAWECLERGQDLRAQEEMLATVREYIEHERQTRMLILVRQKIDKERG